MHGPSLPEVLRLQAKQCAPDSPLYAGLLLEAAQDAAEGGPVARLVEGWEGHSVLDALPMRIMGAVHGEVLAGRAPALARFYPSVGGEPAPAAWPAFRQLVEDSRERLRPRLDQQVQTNEVGRTVALLGGFLSVAQETGLPLAVLEIGASAGLNLLFDRHRYLLGPHRWGNPRARLRLQRDWSGPPPPLDAKLHVVSRAGCDLAPVDLEDSEARLRLQSFVWPDQPHRLAELRTAIELAREEELHVEQSFAAAWLDKRLAAPQPGAATVLYQSAVWWYLSEAERAQVAALVEAAGERASVEAPLAWLRMEGSRRQFTEVRLRTWPGGEDRLLARSHWHGRHVEWCEASPSKES